ncbi:MAG: putative nucleotidyltransferase substrate binding domain-containing protein [Pseudomonadota bacterium]
MAVDLKALEDFLAGHPAFKSLPADALADLSRQVEVVRALKGETLVEPGQKVESLSLIRAGGVEVRAPDESTLMHLGEGEAFGVRALLGEGTAPNRILCLEDLELLQLPKSVFARLGESVPGFSEFFVPMVSRDETPAPTGADGAVATMSADLTSIMTPEPVTIEQDSSIRSAAQLMRSRDISCLPVMAQDSLVGIVTDSDLRDRVVAEGLDVERPVVAVMTPNPVTIEAGRPALDVLLVMTQKRIRHLPVTERGRLIGIITNTNLVRRQSQSAVYLVSDIARRRTPEELAQIVAQVPRLLVDLVESGAAAHSVGHIVTSICDAVTRRLIGMAEAELGPPPVPYVWLASGSQARQEQTGVSDQDNCLLLDDAYDPESHSAYFTALSRWVCDGLNVCGYVYCPGEMMAVTDKWRQPMKAWRKYFTSWIAEPAPMAQMLTSVLFDLRPIFGESGLFQSLQDFAVKKAQANSIFIAHLVGNALTHTPPIGFFRNFVLIRGGEHKHHFDMKHSGVVPIIDIARVYALKAGLTEVSTRQRLQAERAGGGLSESGAQDLVEAFEFISITRLKHQSHQIQSGEAPDNFMSPEDLSHFERTHLKEAFNIVKTIQSAMASSHQMGAR